MSKAQTQVISEQLDMGNPFRLILGIRYTELVHLCFKIKLLQKDSWYYNYIRKKLIDFQEYIAHNLHSFLILLIHSQQNDIYQEKFISDLKEIIDKEYNELREYIIWYSYVEINLNKLKKDMDLVLQKFTHEHINIV